MLKNTWNITSSTIFSMSSVDAQSALPALPACSSSLLMLKLAVGADVGANGATRLAGSLNIKEIYCDGYPTVRLKRLSGRVLALAELRAVGLVGAEDNPPCVPPPGARSAPSDAMPDYGECVSNARRTASGEIDRRAVDYSYPIRERLTGRAATQ